MFASQVTQGHRTVEKIMTEVRRQYRLGGSAHRMVNHLFSVSEGQRRIYYQQLIFGGTA